MQALCRVGQTEKGEEGSVFYSAKGCIFFRLFLSKEPGTGLYFFPHIIRQNFSTPLNQQYLEQ
jgi:hypothetical protein